MSASQDELDVLMRSVPPAPAAPSRGLRIEARRLSKVRPPALPAGRRDELDAMLEESPALAGASTGDELDDLLAGVAAAPSGTTRKPRSYGAYEAFQPAGASWTIQHADKVKEFYRSTFGRDLPVSAYGQSGTHNRLGLDHSQSMDVPLTPVGAEGRRLAEFLRANGIPFLAYDRAVKGAATGAHFHIGNPSHHIGAGGVAPAAAAPMTGDELDSLLEEMPQTTEPQGDDDQIVESINVNANAGTAQPATPSVKSPQTFDIHTTEGRAQRDAQNAAESDPNVAARLSVQLPLEYSNLTSREVAEMAARNYARAEGLPEEFADKWLAQHPEINLYARDGRTAELLDVLGSPSFDEATRTLNVTAALPKIAQMKRDYEASRSQFERSVDWATSDETTAGEKFLDVAAPLVGAAGRAGDLATRPLQGASTAFWSLARKHSPADAVRDGWTEFRTGATPNGAGNLLAERVRASETLRGINKNLPEMIGGVVEVLTDPSNMIPLGVLARGGGFLRSLKGVRAVEEALLASRNARVLEFFNAGGRVLKIEAPPLERIAGQAAADAADGAASHLIVTLQDAQGNAHRINTRSGQIEEMITDDPLASLSPPLRAERDAHAATVDQLDEEIRAAETALERGTNEAGEELTVADFADLRSEISNATELKRGYEHLIGVIDAHADEVMRARAAASSPPAAPPAAPAPAPATTSRVRSVARVVSDVINLPKALRASFDWSGLLNQGGIVVGARPSLARGAIKDATAATVSKDAYETFAKNLLAHPDAQLRKDSGLFLASIGGGEENFASNFAKHIPGVAHSERAYNVTLDSLRSNAFDLYTAELKAAGVSDPKSFRDVARWINVSTGRGELHQLEPLAAVLNLPFFSPRLLAARAQVINPIRYARMTPAARKIALREMFRATRTLGVTMGLSKLAGADVGLDPFEGDFGKITHSETSYDLAGGRLRLLRFAAMLADSIAREQNGEQVDDKLKPSALIKKFFRAYASPSAALAIDAWTGEDFDGEPFEWKQGELERLIPLAVADVIEGYQASGKTGAAKALPAFVGVGVGVNTREKAPEPIKPTLSDATRGELDRLGVDLDHLGEKGKQDANISPYYQTKGITGDSIKPFGDDSGKRAASRQNIDAQAVAKQLSDELEAALSEAINSPDYNAFETNEARRKYLEMLIINTKKRILNGVRVDARGRELEKEQKVKERLERMSPRERNRNRIHFKL